jgi:putative transposase
VAAEQTVTWPPPWLETSSQSAGKPPASGPLAWPPPWLEAPGQTTAEPGQTTAEPEQTTAEPEQTTAEPEQTTAEPEQTTAEPEQTAAELPADRELSPGRDHTPAPEPQKVAELREHVVELLERSDEQERRSRARLREQGTPDNQPVEGSAVNRLLASEEQAILDLIDTWAPLDRSYRKLAYRGSYTGSVFVSPSTLQRVALKHQVTVPGEPPRPPRRKLVFPEVPWEPNRIWMWEASLFPAVGRVAYAIVDVVTRYWVAYLLASEQVPVELPFALAREEQGLHNGGGTPGSDSGPILVAWSDDDAETIAAGTPTATAYMESFFGLLKGEWPRLTLPSDPDALDQELARVRDEYNTVRLHAGVGYVTPSDEHNGRGPQIRRARDDGLRRARAERIKQNRMLDQ